MKKTGERLSQGMASFLWHLVRDISPATIWGQILFCWDKVWDWLMPCYSGY